MKEKLIAKYGTIKEICLCSAVRVTAISLSIYNVCGLLQRAVMGNDYSGDSCSVLTISLLCRNVRSLVNNITEILSHESVKQEWIVKFVEYLRKDKEIEKCERCCPASLSINIQCFFIRKQQILPLSMGKYRMVLRDIWSFGDELKP